jgi:DNA-binding transcriptional regulator YdaS (Cro superfamily)
MQDDLKKAAKQAIKQAGGGAALALKLRLKRQAIYQWQRVPPQHVQKVEEITGIPRHRLRPDLYPADREQESAA